ncbi:MAG TPA: sigma-70 family RNA polymerase sigma factor [Kofleriaceae bacterium]|nr:sigma-70 family RNA polymerase sigma factor [Kofleriaceae bacterium]
MPDVAPAMAAVRQDVPPRLAAAALAFEDVYAQHVRFVWRTVRSFGVAEAQLEDAVQDVFIVVHRRLAEFAGRARIETWLFAIARRVAGAYRRTAMRKSDRNDAIDDVVLAAADDTFAALSRAQAAAAVTAVLDTFDEDKRIVFTLVELEQMPVPDVAELLGINLNTAYSRLRLARRAFEAAVAKRPSEEP